MNNQLQTIQQEFKKDDVKNRLAIALGYKNYKDNEKAQARTKQVISSVLTQIKKSNDLMSCNVESIIDCVVDATRFNLVIDGRQHAHLIPFKGKCTFQVGYRGLISKIVESYKDVDFCYGFVYESDEFEVFEKNSYTHYKHKKADAFNRNKNQLKGVYVAISYDVGGERTQKVETLNKDEIEQIKSNSKTDKFWGPWFNEKAKVACLKRACKIHFTKAQGLQEIIEYDNQNYKDMKEDPKPEVDKSFLEDDYEGEIIEGEIVEVSTE